MPFIDRKRIKAKLLAQARGRCEYCGSALALDAATIDHWQSRASGGSDAASNLRIACIVCNRAKADMSPNDFLAWLDRVARHRARVSPPAAAPATPSEPASD